MHIHHLALRTRNIEGLISFYQDMLGLHRVREQAGYSVWLQIGEGVIMIEQATDAEPGVPAGSRELLAFAVNPAQRERLVERLQENGVSIEERSDYTIYFRDPDGRRVALSTYDLCTQRPT